ncbi:MAG: TonB-dependent receptor, partial [Pseudomonadota bacterium]
MLLSGLWAQSRQKQAVLLVLIAIFITSFAGFASSQSSSQDYDIQAGSLNSVLSEFAAQAGLLLSADAELTSGKSGTGLLGTYSTEQAIEILLQGTGLTYQLSPEGTLTITAPAENDGPLVLAPIKVKGELLERDLQNSQASAVVLDGETVDIGVSTDFSEVIERTPGIINTGGSISIRGIGESPNGVSGERTINVQVDGTTFGVQSRLSSTDFSTWDLEQVDILRGPQSTQTGRNALAGAIIVRSRDPEYYQELRVKLGYASFDTGQAAIALNTPLVDDRLALRFSYDHTTTDGEISTPAPGVDDIDGEENTTARLGLRWDPTDQLFAVLKFSRLEIDRAFPFVDTATLPDFVNTVDFQSQEDSELDSVNLRVTYDVDSAWSLVSSSAFSDF